MLQTGPALKVSVYLNRDTGSTEGFLYDSLLRLLQKRGIAGATAIRAHAGFGAHHRLHSSDAGDAAGEHLPVIVIFIDDTEKIKAILPDVMRLVTDGLVEVQPTEIVKWEQEVKGILT